MNKNKTSETISGVMAPYGFDSTGYDSQDRLTAWSRTDGNLNQSWNLSKEGDWDSFTENTATENRTHNEVHELTGIDATPLAYDAKGNLTQNANGQTYTWDFDNRIASATVPAGCPDGIEGTHAYTYDALGRRVSKTVDNSGTIETTVFASGFAPLNYSPYAGQVVSEYAAGVIASSPDRNLVYGAYIDEPIVLIDSPGTMEQVYYFHTNSLHSVAVLTDDSGSVGERYSYTAYGGTIVLAGDGSTPRSMSLISNPFTYTGRRHDNETRLHYYRARYLDSQMGSFLSRDPIGFDGSEWNLYQSVAANPLTNTDPSGLLLGPVGSACAAAAATDAVVPEPTDVAAPIKVPIWVIVIGIGVGIDVIRDKNPPKKCPPCPWPPKLPKDKLPRVDRVPPSKKHYPCPGDHLHTYWYETHQRPYPSCACYYRLNEHVTCL